MKILDEPITANELLRIAEDTFGDLVKAVIDVRKRLIAIDAELHSDLEALLIANGSRQNDLWGINFYPALAEDEFIEYDSLINMRPSQGNLSRGVEDAAIRKEIVQIIDKWVKR
ncbi:MAG: hypothetical protein JSU64_06490 [candidate division WOR-3 bacterium]|nr:MAG: hypothetical protein JSU64_06490 [candidate division WOR-3 bacterium]UCF04968.1 MAG: hypothetical protein JSV33_13755 [bacterium]